MAAEHPPGPGDDRHAHHQHDEQHEQHDEPDEHSRTAEHARNDREEPDMTVIIEQTIGRTAEWTTERSTERSTVSRAPVSSTAISLIDRSAAGLLQACAARTAGERYVCAHLAALRSAAAVLAVRGRSSRGGPRSVWDLVPRVAPELTEWSAFFAATAGRRAAIESGRGAPVTPREADDLLRDAEAFQHVVEGLLGLPQYPVLPDSLPACS